MKKKITGRALSGFFIGIAIGYIISIVTSLIWGDGFYAPCVPELASRIGSEINAVILQAFLCGLLGAVFSVGSIIWEIDRWSIARQTGTYFLISCATAMPVAYITYWMEHSVMGFVSYLGSFTLIFFLIWAAELAYVKYNINKMNACLHQKNEE